MTQIEIKRNGAVLTATITITPDGFMDPVTEDELGTLLDQVDSDDGVRAVVFTGGMPDVFIRNYDVGVLSATAERMAGREMRFETTRSVPESPYHVCLRRITESPVAFIAAINGTAMGGGFELALACDIRIALDGAYDLGLPEINIGLLPGAGGTQRLPRLIGEGRAFEMVARGRTLSPAEALDWGIVSEVVAKDVAARGLEIAEELSRKPARAFRNIKRLMRTGFDRPLAEGLADERTLFCDVMVDEETIARMADLNDGKRDIRDRD